MIKWILGLAAAAALSACEMGSSDAEQAQQAVTQVLSFRQDVKFRNLASYPGKVVCGEFEEQNTMGGSYGFKHFIVRDGAADTHPADNDLLIFCSEDSAASLRATLGINSPAQDKPALRQIMADLAAMSAAIAQYLADTHMLPTNRQGLDALVTLTTTPPLPRGFRQGGYLAALPNDPWDRSYHYDNSALGGSVGTYSLYTLGADNAPGGEAENADIDVKHLKYLQHILSLQD